MKWVTYLSQGNAQPRCGVVQGESVCGATPELSIIDALGLGADGMSQLAQTIIADPDEVVALSSVKLLAPVPVPPSIRDFMAFEDHASNSMKAAGASLSPVWYEVPVFYFTNPRAPLVPA
jgi:hypothetical protein